MGLLGKLFGSKNKTTTTNQAYDFLKGAYGPATGYVGDAGGAISRFLGGDPTGFDAYKRGAGFDFALGEGLKGITGSRAAHGLLRSGSTGQRFLDFNQQLGNQYAGNYVQQLMGLGNLGLNAGQVLASAAPQTQTSKSGGGGLGKLLGAGLAIFSDPRLKTNIERVGDLGVYKYRYKWDPPGTIRRGVMADEIERVLPEALGPEIAGFRTVRMDRLAEGL